jgi:hypothetical protein
MPRKAATLAERRVMEKPIILPCLTTFTDTAYPIIERQKSPVDHFKSIRWPDYGGSGYAASFAAARGLTSKIQVPKKPLCRISEEPVF